MEELNNEIIKEKEVIIKENDALIANINILTDESKRL